MSRTFRQRLLRRMMSLEIETIDGQSVARFRSTRAPFWIFTVEAIG